MQDKWGGGSPSQTVLSHNLLNPYGEIGSEYPSMSMIVISLLLPILRQRWRCLPYDVYELLDGCCKVVTGSKYLEHNSSIRIVEQNY
jgi:hypothetical protein